MGNCFGGEDLRRMREETGGFSGFQVHSARPAAGMLRVVAFEVVAFVLGAATGTDAEARLAARTAVVCGLAAVSV